MGWLRQGYSDPSLSSCALTERFQREFMTVVSWMTWPALGDTCRSEHLSSPSRSPRIRFIVEFVCRVLALSIPPCLILFAERNLWRLAVQADAKALQQGPGRFCSPRHPKHFEPSSLDLNGILYYDVASNIRRALSSYTLRTLVS